MAIGISSEWNEVNDSYPHLNDKQKVVRLKSALEAMVNTYLSKDAYSTHMAPDDTADTDSLAIRTLAELFPDEWHNRIPAERRVRN